MATRYQKQLPLEVGHSHTVELPPRVLRVRLTGLLFETDKTFLLPRAMKGIRGLVDYYEQHPNMAVVVTGHTDRVGDDPYNLGLSDERSRAIASYLKDEVDGWLVWYQKQPHSSVWGVREDQHMLSVVSDSDGQGFYRGPVQGQLDPATQDAVRRFQKSRGLAEDGVPGPDTRRALVTAYMQLDGTTLPASCELGRLGCGEHHNEVPTADGVAEEANRRVEIFLFDPGPPDPAAPARCPGDGCSYLEWKKRLVETIDFEHGLCDLTVHCQTDDDKASPVPDADVQLSRGGEVQRRGRSDDNGFVEFHNLLPGSWHLGVTKKGYGPFERDLELHPGEVRSGSGDDQHAFYPDGNGGSGGAGSGGGGGGGGTQVNATLSKKLWIIEIVGEIPEGSSPPGLMEAAKRGVANRGKKAWEGVWVGVTYKTTTWYHGVDENGMLTLPYDPDVPSLELTELGGNAVQERSIRYTLWEPHASGDKIVDKLAMTVNVPTKVKISTRIRMSIWCFGAPFLDVKGAGVKFHTDTLQLIKDAHIDDVSLVNTLAPPDSNWTLGDKGAVTVNSILVDWSDAFRPGAVPKSDTAVRTSYVSQLVSWLHKNKIQLLLGYTIGNKGNKPDLPPAGASKKVVDQYNADLKSWQEVQVYCDGWARWLKALKPSQVRDHALVIALWVKQLKADGVGFDIENTFVGGGKVPNLELLYRETAKALHFDNGIVSYANGPFTVDGVTSATHGGTVAVLYHMEGQPYSLAKDIPNLIARPMCYDKTAYDFSPGLVTSLACALGEGQGNGGLDPSQVQFAIDVGTAVGTEAFVRDHLRANRVGLVVYQVSQEKSAADSTLRTCKTLEQKLNSGEVAPPTWCQPAQVPADPFPAPKKP